jgi:hypothetical protein
VLEGADGTTLLEVYLDDHLAAGTAGLALARRCLGNNPDNELGAYLRQMVDELEEDRRMLTTVIERLGLRPNVVKVAGALAAERVGRLKLNGQLRGYSPLSRLVEVEGLAVGVDARGSMLRSLRALADSYPALREFPLDERIDRADRQRRDLEAFRLAAAETALTP